MTEPIPEDVLMSTDQTDQTSPRAPTGRERPGSLDEALGGRPAPDIRSLWDGLVAAPTTADPLSDRLLAPPVAEPPVAPVVEPTSPSITDLPPATGPAAAPPSAPGGPITPPDAEEDDDATDHPSRGDRRAARKAARRAAQDEKDRQRSDRLELRRHRILPRTVIGISMLLLAAAVGAAASGAGLYAYYDWRLSENETRVGTLTATLENRLTEANADIEDVQARAINGIRTAAAPLEQLLADTRTVSDLTPALAPSVFFISTRDVNGAPSVGSGFVVSSDSSQSLILTSYRTVAAATASPAPPIEVRGDDDSIDGRLHSWDEDRDLALIIIDRGDQPALTWASDEVRAEALGRRVYVASGLGGAGVSLSPGLVIDQSAAGIQHSAPVGNAWQGGPLLTAEGEVLGIASVAYAPLGFDPGALPFAVPVDAACERVLTCSGDGGPG